MPTTINAIGNKIAGERKLTLEEFEKWKSNFPKEFHTNNNELYIGTESFMFGLIPIEPTKTYVYYRLTPPKKFPHSLFSSSSFQYVILFYPAGENNVYQPHVKNNRIFSIFPWTIKAVVIFIVLWYISAQILNYLYWKNLGF